MVAKVASVVIRTALLDLTDVSSTRDVNVAFIIECKCGRLDKALEIFDTYKHMINLNATTIGICQAVEVGHNGLCKAILEYVVIVNQNGLETFQLAEERGPLLHTACSFGRDEVANILIAYGANINEKNCYNETPMIIACKKQRVLLIYDLIRAGSDVQHAISYYQKGSSDINDILQYASRWKVYTQEANYALRIRSERRWWKVNSIMRWLCSATRCAVTPAGDKDYYNVAIKHQ